MRVSRMARNEAMILKLARVVDLTHADAFLRTITGGSGGTFGLPLADIIDIDVEKERLKNLLENWPGIGWFTRTVEQSEICRLCP